MKVVNNLASEEVKTEARARSTPGSAGEGGRCVLNLGLFKDNEAEALESVAGGAGSGEAGN